MHTYIICARVHAVHTLVHTDIYVQHAHAHTTDTPTYNMSYTHMYTHLHTHGTREVEGPCASGMGHPHRPPPSPRFPLRGRGLGGVNGAGLVRLEEWRGGVVPPHRRWAPPFRLLPIPLAPHPVCSQPPPVRVLCNRWLFHGWPVASPGGRCPP